METKTAKNRSIDTLLILYDLHTKLFSNVLNGITDKDAHNRLNTKANHIAWLAGSLVQERYELAGVLGADPETYQNKQSALELFRDHNGIQDGITYPPLLTFEKDWKTITPVLRNALVHASDRQLEKPFEMPGETMTVFDLITFVIHREAYCIGQIGLYRRLLGYAAMKYE